MVDQPSTQFGSLGIPAVTKVGVELDRELAAPPGRWPYQARWSTSVHSSS